MPDLRALDRPEDLKRRLEAERIGLPFVHFRDGAGQQHIVSLDSARPFVTVGRDPDCDVCLSWDERVSRLHARLERGGGSWSVYDGGLSRNGTYVNGDRVGHRALRDRDELVVGGTPIWFRDPTVKRASSTVVASERLAALTVTPAQRRVLIALCRPYKDHSAFAKPATNQQIADELVLSIDSVKTHLRALFATLELEALPQNEKRVRLAERAFQRGLVRDSDL